MNQLEGSTLEQPVAESLSTISGTENEPPIQVTDHKQKVVPLFCLSSFCNFSNAWTELYYNLKHLFNFKQGIMISVDEGTALTNTKTTSKHITTSHVSLFYVTMPSNWHENGIDLVKRCWKEIWNKHQNEIKSLL